MGPWVAMPQCSGGGVAQLCRARVAVQWRGGGGGARAPSPQIATILKPCPTPPSTPTCPALTLPVPLAPTPAQTPYLKWMRNQHLMSMLYMLYLIAVVVNFLGCLW